LSESLSNDAYGRAKVVVKLNLTLSNPTTGNWAIWEGLEPEIKEIMSQQECLKMIKSHKEKYKKEEK